MAMVKGNKNIFVYNLTVYFSGDIFTDDKIDEDKVDLFQSSLQIDLLKLKVSAVEIDSDFVGRITAYIDIEEAMDVPIEDTIKEWLLGTPAQQYVLMRSKNGRIDPNYRVSGRIGSSKEYIVDVIFDQVDECNDFVERVAFDLPKSAELIGIDQCNRTATINCFGVYKDIKNWLRNVSAKSFKITKITNLVDDIESDEEEVSVEERFVEFMMGPYLEFNKNGYCIKSTHKGKTYFSEMFDGILKGLLKDGLKADMMVAGKNMVQVCVESILAGYRYAMDDDGKEIRTLISALEKTVSEDVWNGISEGILQELLSVLKPPRGYDWEEFVFITALNLRACIFKAIFKDLSKTGHDWSQIEGKYWEEFGFPVDVDATEEMCLSYFKYCFEKNE